MFSSFFIYLIYLPSPQVQFFGDIELKNGLATTVDDVIQIMKDVPNLVKKLNGGKGAQLEFTLLPLEAIEKVVLEEENTVDRSVQPIDDDMINECEGNLEEVLWAKQKFNDLHERVKENAHVLMGKVLVDFNKMKTKTNAIRDKYLMNLRKEIVDVSSFM